MSSPFRLVVLAVADTGLVFGLMAFLYVAAVAVTAPDQLSQPISTLLHVRTDSFGLGAFVVSFVGAQVRAIAAGNYQRRGGAPQ